MVEKTEVNSRGGVVGGKVLTRLECSLAYHARYQLAWIIFQFELKKYEKQIDKIK